MGEISKAIEGWNVPKQVMEKAEKAFKAILGPSVTEISETIGDNFKFRRFKNQIKILEKSEKYLKEKGISPKKLDLKILVPLLDFTSLEEDESLQDLWAKLISNLVTVESSQIVKKRAVETLSNLSNEDIAILNILMEKLKESPWFTHYAENLKAKTNMDDFYRHMRKVSFSKWVISKEFEDNYPDSEFQIYNVVDLGLIDYKKAIKLEQRTRSYHRSMKKSLTLDNVEKAFEVKFENNKSIFFTRFGLEFVLLCSNQELFAN